MFGKMILSIILFVLDKFLKYGISLLDIVILKLKYFSWHISMFILHKEMPEGWGILMHGSRIGYRLFGKKAYSIIPFSIDEYRKYACL